MGSVIVITSGKGGTGKTSLTGGIGAALALQGRQVLCIDADVGLRNLDITLGMTDAAGNLHLETTVSLPAQPAWVDGAEAGRDPAGWIGAWLR